MFGMAEDVSIALRHADMSHLLLLTGTAIYGLVQSRPYGGCLQRRWWVSSTLYESNTHADIF